MRLTHFFSCLFSLAALTAQASEPSQARTCIACHGEKGVSNNDLWPNIAGQKEQYLEKQLKDFRDGNRDDQLMTNIAKMLTDEEIKELAAYFSKLKAGP